MWCLLHDGITVGFDTHSVQTKGKQRDDGRANDLKKNEGKHSHWGPTSEMSTKYDRAVRLV